MKNKLRDAEEEIANGLQKLTSEGGSSNFLIVSSGDCYVQFAGSQGNRTLCCEAVSSKYLPAGLQLSPEKISELERRGFALGESGNFSRSLELGWEGDARKLARMAIEILERVYGCSRDAGVEIQLNLE